MLLRPLDLVVALELAADASRDGSYAEIAKAVGSSASEANQAAHRAVAAGLFAPPARPRGKPLPQVRTLLDFLRYGVRHAFFAAPDGVVRGIPTAHSAPPLRDQIVAGDELPMV